jgi:hypothetical protein
LKTLSTDKKINLIYFKIKNIFKKYLKAALELEAMLNTPQKKTSMYIKTRYSDAKYQEIIIQKKNIQSPTL